jgi:hypothetical protein
MKVYSQLESIKAKLFLRQEASRQFNPFNPFTVQTLASRYHIAQDSFQPTESNLTMFSSRTQTLALSAFLLTITGQHVAAVCSPGQMGKSSLPPT